MLRQDALTWLNSQPALAAYATDTGVGIGDNPAGWLSVIDNTLRAMGLAITDEVPGSREQDCRLLLRYFALEQFTDLYAMRVDLNLSTVGFEKKKSQAYTALKERLAEARNAVQILGYIVGGDTVTIGRVTLDYLEPWSPLSY